MDNLEEMDKFFRRYNIPRLNQEKIENMNSMSWQLRWRTSAAERSYPAPEDGQLPRGATLHQR